jgi:hypothetical protein
MYKFCILPLLLLLFQLLHSRFSDPFTSFILELRNGIARSSNEKGCMS